jgi:hypothetical protein
VGRGVAYEPISLGHTCEVKYQISRALFFRKNPSAPKDAVRHIINQNLGSRYFPRHIFDFQITPFSAACEYMERDFQGVFERDDLFVDPATGHVTHRTLGTSHPHDFWPPENGADQTFIDQEYPAARSKFEHLAERFRRHLRSPGRLLYVFMEYRSAAEAENLLRLLNRWDGHEARLLLVDAPERDMDLSGLEGRVFKATRRPVSDKAPDHVWEGDDAGWDETFAPFPLATHPSPHADQLQSA